MSRTKEGEVARKLSSAALHLDDLRRASPFIKKKQSNLSVEDDWVLGFYRFVSMQWITSCSSSPLDLVSVAVYTEVFPERRAAPSPVLNRNLGASL